MGVFHKPSAGVGCRRLTLSKVPESRAGDHSPQVDWLGGLLAALGFGGIVFALIESAPVAGVAGGIALIALLYREARSPSPLVPLICSVPAILAARTYSHFLLRRVERCSLLFSARFDTGARIFSDRGGGGSAAFHFVDVLAFALVWRTH